MKRFAWRWGAVLGAVLLPALLAACSYGGESYWLPPDGMHVTSTNQFTIVCSAFLRDLSNLTRQWGLWSAGLGCCGAMLLMGHRSLWWRLLGTCVGSGTTAYLSWNLWNHWYLHTLFTRNSSERWYPGLYVGAHSPLLLAALLLVFFALLVRASPTPATKS